MYDQTPEAIAEASDIIEEAIRIEPTGPRAHRVRIQVFVNYPWIEETPYDSASQLRVGEDRPPTLPRRQLWTSRHGVTQEP